MRRCYELARFVGISKTPYVLATPRFLEWRHDLPRTSTNNDASASHTINDPSDSDSQDPSRRPARRHRGDRRPRLPVAGVLVLDGRITPRRPSQRAPWRAWRSAAQHGVAGTWPSRVRPDRTVAGPTQPEPARGCNRQPREGNDGLSRAP